MIVYGLFDPRNGQLRYVGRTEKRVEIRLQQHLQPAYLRPNTHKNAWLKSLLRDGMRPEIWVLEEDALPEDEERLISYFRFVGCDLTNGTVGGEGWRLGTRHSEEAKAKISKAHSGKKKGPSPFRGKRRNLSDETRRKMSESARKRSVSDETRLKHSKVKRIVVDELGHEYLTAEDAARKLGIHSYLVGLVLKGIRKDVHGHRFHYKGLDEPTGS